MAKSSSAFKRQINALKHRQGKGTDDDIMRRIEHAYKYVEPYDYTGCVDPSLAFHIDNYPIKCPPFLVMGADEKRPVDAIYVYDIETYQMRPDRLHFGYLMNAETKEAMRFRSWHNTYELHRERIGNDKYKEVRKLDQIGLIEIIEDIVYQQAQKARATGEKSSRSHLYAHNQHRFDGVGLASSIYSNHDLDILYSSDNKKEQKSERQEFLIKHGADEKDVHEMRPNIKWALKHGLSLDNNIKRIRYYRNEETGRKRKVTFTWRISGKGKRLFMEVCLGYHTMRILDSHWHLAQPLSALGAKGITPKQYTDPVAWLDDEIREGRLVISEDATYSERQEARFHHWHDVLTDEADQYCLDDCRILAEALLDYRRIIGERFTDPGTGLPFDPLAYLTSAQAARTCQTLCTQPHKLEKTGYAIYRPGPSEHGGGWHFESESESRENILYDFILNCKPVATSIPYAPRGMYAITPNAWYCWREDARAWRRAQFGGRTEIFAPRNPEGTEIEAIDINSSYSSEMLSQRYIDPRNINPLKSSISGRENILNHLRRYSGIYLVEMSEPENAIIRNELPIFPVRLGGEDYDSRLIFPRWEGRFLNYVTGEELRYFLELTDVVDDDIKIHAKKSLCAPLIDNNILPFHQFVGLIYNARQEAVRAGRTREANYLKLFMNAGGYGTLVQANNETFFIRENDPGDATQKAIHEIMLPLSPDWQGWVDYFNGDVGVLETARTWAKDHYRACSNADIVIDDMPIIKRVSIELPNAIAPHAIPPWGCAIAANGRIALHKALMAVRRAGFVVLYCDTDSVYFAKPKGTDRALVVERLQSITNPTTQKPVITIGDGLGQWKFEEPQANEALITPDCNVRDGKIVSPQGFFLAPKHYYLTDEKLNVLKEVVKGVPKRDTKMRCAMLSYMTPSAKVGDAIGSKLAVIMDRDLTTKIMEGKGVKRVYRTDKAMSEPVTLKNIKHDEGQLAIDYLVNLARSARGNANGIRIALREYMSEAKIAGEGVYETREAIQRKMNEIKAEALDRGYRVPINYVEQRKVDAGLSTSDHDDMDDLPI